MRQKWAILVCATLLVVGVLSVPLQGTQSSSSNDSSRVAVTGSVADTKPPPENPTQNPAGTKSLVSEANVTDSSNITDSEAVTNDSDASKDPKATAAAAQKEKEVTSAKGGAEGTSPKAGDTENSDQETQNPAGDKASSTKTPDDKARATVSRKGDDDATGPSVADSSKIEVPADATRGAAVPITGDKPEASTAAGNKGDKETRSKDDTVAPAQGDKDSQPSKAEATVMAGADKDDTVAPAQGDKDSQASKAGATVTAGADKDDTVAPAQGDKDSQSSKAEATVAAGADKDATEPVTGNQGGDTAQPKEDEGDGTVQPKEDEGDDTVQPKDDQGSDTTQPKDEEDKEEKENATMNPPAGTQVALDNSGGSISFDSDGNGYGGSSMSGSGPEDGESYRSDTDDAYDGDERIGAADSERDRLPVSNTSGKFTDDPDSHFFAYFLTIMVTAIIFYLVFHNKQRIIALIIEGRAPRSMRTRRASSRAKYHKLDNNLEEAITATKGTNGC